MLYLYPSLETVLQCPYRYTQQQLRREHIPGVFAGGYFGKVIHQRIACCLRTGQPINRSNITLPGRLILQADEDLETLTQRAHYSLEQFEKHCLPWLQDLTILAVEHKIRWTFARHQTAVTLSGVLDLIVATAHIPPVFR